EKAAEKDQRHPIGDGHGQKIAGGGECHQRGEEHQSNGVGNQDHGVVMRECTRSARPRESGNPELRPLPSSLLGIRSDAGSHVATNSSWRCLAVRLAQCAAFGLAPILFQRGWTKAELSLEPNPCMTAIMATEMPAATRPYSTAVAPDWSCKKRFQRLGIAAPTVHSWRSEFRLSRCCPADPEPGCTLAASPLRRG